MNKKTIAPGYHFKNGITPTPLRTMPKTLPSSSASHLGCLHSRSFHLVPHNHLSFVSAWCLLRNGVGAHEHRQLPTSVYGLSVAGGWAVWEADDLRSELFAAADPHGRPTCSQWLPQRSDARVAENTPYYLVKDRTVVQ